MRYLAWYLCATAMYAQWTVITDVPTGAWDRAPAIAKGPDGDIWVGGGDRVARISPEGETRWSARVPVSAIAAIVLTEPNTAFVTGMNESGDGVLVRINGSGVPAALFPLTGRPSAITSDSSGSLYIAGWADQNFATTPGAYKASIGPARCIRPRSTTYFPCSDGFVMKLRSTGAVEWATLIGGTWNDNARTLTMDSSGSVWVAGETMSSDFPTTRNAMQSRFGGLVTLGPIEFGDGFIARLSSNGSQLLYSTYLGGTSVDWAASMAAISDGVVITGATQSADFPVTGNARQPAFAGPLNVMPRGALDAFVVHLRLSGERVYATYYGGSTIDFGTSVAAEDNGNVSVALWGREGSCVLGYDPRTNNLEEKCFRLVLHDPFGIVFAGGHWIAAGSTQQGLEVPGVTPFPRMIVTPLAGIGDNSGPVVVGAWNEYIPLRRPLVAAGSVITIYHAGVGRAGPDNTTVLLGDRRLPILYAGGDQINATVPFDIPIGLHALRVAMPFFGTVPVPVDVIPRWPGLYSGALNQNGSVNSESNPAAHGEIVSLFGNGFGPEPLPVIEPYIASTGPPPSTAQGMEVLFAGRAPGTPEGIYQVNARIPMNAQTGRVPVRLVFRVENGFLQSPLGYIWVK